MPIKTINCQLRIKTRSNEIAKIICTAIKPDNRAKPPMVLEALSTANTLHITIKNVKRVETMLVTLLDLFSTFQAAENVLNLDKSDCSS